ncbi:pentatricopeptide repeat-containing protein At4g02750-like [Selaginella moellendorffii]|uniref:pentatricopeptide repeat-containing protein At4g02750-like n=1 Tax=Selaginella moellendorffii TaxID=88036 RepID=UPI000D1C234B|nr:pentatricopeptide repeat-containing protein At4g02750-like [Selaginella moellendorffii]|eukprot:XP_024518598.1 pentatricopeptide repeat-containing protein At4g02750-like [Selaginella moellendorffii]
MRVEKLTAALNNLSLKADTATYASLLRQCRDSQALIEGKMAHTHITKNGYGNDTYIANLLIEMYGACRRLDLAGSVFDGMIHRNVYTWNIMFAANAQNGHFHRAKWLFDTMPERDSVSWSAVLHMYEQNFCMAETLRVFQMIPRPDVVAWTVLIAAFAKKGHFLEAQRLFDDLDCPNTVTWNVMIQAYAQRGDLDRASELVTRMPSPDVVSWTAIVTANAYHGNLSRARRLFDAMPQRNIVSWNAIVQSHALHGGMEEAHNLFDEMPRRNVVSWTSMVASYAKNGYLYDARSMFDLMPEQDTASWNAILDAYGDCGDLAEAKKIFVSAPERNVVSWTALIKAFAASLDSEDAATALQLPAIMDLEGVAPDEVTFIAAIDACAGLAALAEGRRFHAAIRDEELEEHFIVGTSIVGMYGKCGRVEEARAVFDRMPVRNDAAWNSIMLAYAQNDRPSISIELFLAMLLDGTKPDGITMVTVLFACSHAGLIDPARVFFLALAAGEFSGLDHPCLDHYVCMVDLFARAGEIKRAWEVFGCMPFEPDELAWTTVASAVKRNAGVNTSEIFPPSIFKRAKALRTS